MGTTIKHEVAFLDFWRGWASLLVFFHHAAILGGGPDILKGVVGKEAVNAFMMASGFLIYFQCSISKSYEGLSSKKGIYNFYVRRFFRIAPAYYFALVFAYLFASELGHGRNSIAEVLSFSSTDMSRYFIEDLFLNIFMHVTFLFGLFPSYAFSTPLPDWSLGLEMQFYFLFPLLFWAYKKNFLKSVIGLMVVGFSIWFLLKINGVKYPMPSFLALKYHNFSAGIVIAYLLLNKNTKPLSLILVTLGFLLLGNRSIYMPVLFLFSWWWICQPKNNTGVILSKMKAIFEHKSSKFLADTSYSLYIIHLLFMIPLYSLLLENGELNPMSWAWYTLLLLLGMILVSYGVYRFIELPGIQFGKKLIKK